MPPDEKSFFEENGDKLDLDDDPIEPIAFVPPTISTLSITDLPSLKKISCFDRFSGIIYTLASSILFTCAAFSIKQIDVDILDALLFRFILQTISTFLFALYHRYPLFPGTVLVKFFQVLCCATGAGGFFIYFVAIRYVEISDVSTLCYTRVVWTVIFSIFMYRERPSISSLIALPLTLLGVVFVTQPSFLFSSSSPSLIIPSSKFRVLGLTLSIISSFTSAANVLSFKQLVSTSKEVKPSVINFQYSFSILVFLILNQFYQKYFLHQGLTLTTVLSWKYVFASFICCAMIISNLLTQKAIKREHPAIFTLLSSADIIFSLILQNIFTSKRSNLFALLGSGLVIFSVLIIGLSKFLTDRHMQKKKKKTVDSSVLLT